MYAADNPQLEQLLKASARDEQTLNFALADEIFGFHAQQAVEKLLKALITARGERHPFTHDLGKLVLQLERLGEAISIVPPGWDFLTEYAMHVRYESGVEFPPDLRDRVRHGIADLRRHVMQRADELKRDGTQVGNP